LTSFLSNLLVGLLSSAIAFMCGVLFHRRHILVAQFWRRGLVTILGTGSKLVVCFSARGLQASDQTTLREGDVMATLDIVRLADRYIGKGRAVIVSPALMPTSRRDLILVGGPHANPQTNAILRMQDGANAVVIVSGYEVTLLDGSSWELATSVDGSIEADYGVIYSMPDPEDGRRRITLVFGLKGFGTRAAARFLASRTFSSETRRLTRHDTYCLLVSVVIVEGQPGPIRLMRRIVC
jgi:hypothetical protein